MKAGCFRCGECCSLMGQVLRIREETPENGFIVENRYTGALYHVSIDPDKGELPGSFADGTGHATDTCPFYRFTGTERQGCCMIHMTRPDICRDYFCSRLTVLDTHGKRVARVFSPRLLQSDTPSFRLLWERYIDPLAIDDEKAWEMSVTEILVRAGYSVLH